MSLARYIFKRVLAMIPVLFGVTLITFLMMHAIPGDPVDFMLQFAPADAGIREELRAQYNLDEPVWKQYLLWLNDLARFDFGTSLITGRDVGASIAARMPYTILLGTAAWIIAMGIAIPAGIYAAINKGQTADEVSRVGALFGIAMPNFWFGLMLLFFFSVQLGWFTVLPPLDAPLFSFEMLWFLILPAVTLGTASTALLMRLMRSSMVEELNKDYVRTARAKGLEERTVILKHVLRNSLISVVTVAALMVASIVDGSVVVEVVFAWPGMGQLIIDAINQRDFPVLQLAVVIIGVSIVLANLVADLVYAALDPRIRY